MADGEQRRGGRPPIGDEIRARLRDDQHAYLDNLARTDGGDKSKALRRLIDEARAVRALLDETSVLRPAIAAAVEEMRRQA